MIARNQIDQVTTLQLVTKQLESRYSFLFFENVSRDTFKITINRRSNETKLILLKLGLATRKLLGSLSKPRRQRQREHRQTKDLLSRKMPAHVHYYHNIFL